MAKLNISPTKTNLINIKKTFVIASEGYDLLEEKRQILIMELMSRVERVRLIEKELSEKITGAYESLKKTFMTMGHADALQKTGLISYDYNMRKKNIRIFGMNIPSVDFDVPELKLLYTFLNTNAVIDETMKKFLSLISLICEKANLRATVMRLAREVKKTQRRVNALEKIVIPDTVETIKFIQDTLEERERDELFVRKLIKLKYERQLGEPSRKN